MSNALTGVAARPASQAAAGGTPSGDDTPNWTATVAAQAQVAHDLEPMRQPNFEAEAAPPETPAKTTFPYAEGERESGMTPYCAEGWQQANARVAMYYDEPGRSETTPVHLATPKRDKQV